MATRTARRSWVGAATASRDHHPAGLDAAARLQRRRLLPATAPIRLLDHGDGRDVVRTRLPSTNPGTGETLAESLAPWEGRHQAATAHFIELRPWPGALPEGGTVFRSAFDSTSDEHPR